MTEQSTVESTEIESTEVEEVEVEEQEQESEEPTTVNFAGMSFPDMETATKTFKEMQSRATKAEQELAKIRKQAELEKAKEEFKNLDPEDQMARLQELILEERYAEAKVEETKQEVAEYVDDTEEVKQFASKHPVLSEYPELASLFEELATTKYKNATLESLYAMKIQPLVDKLGGKRVVIKKKVVGNPQGLNQFSPEVVAKMSKEEYEKHRPAIIASMAKK